ncbi:MAG: hypothetical protein RR448_04060 [Niameybacter sp.]|uniref:hypothetical protein n=1 Tax=Niameybacter sp. TaxID=2033640 RepID=UPI002FC976EE
MEHQVEISDLTYYVPDYDLEGLIRVSESAGAAFVLMEYDDLEDKYCRNRYDVIEPHMSIATILKGVDRYLEQGSENALFVTFAVEDGKRLTVFDGSGKNYTGIDLGDLELGENLIYGLLIRLEDEAYIFDEVLYTDGGLNKQSWAEKVYEAGEMTALLADYIQQFI